MEIPQSYRELESILCNQYDEVDGCAFYQYIFPDNEKQGEMHTDYSLTKTSRTRGRSAD